MLIKKSIGIDQSASHTISAKSTFKQPTEELKFPRF